MIRRYVVTELPGNRRDVMSANLRVAVASDLKLV